MVELPQRSSIVQRATWAHAPSPIHPYLFKPHASLWFHFHLCKRSIFYPLSHPFEGCAGIAPKEAAAEAVYCLDSWSKLTSSSACPTFSDPPPVFVYVWEHKQFVANFSVARFCCASPCPFPAPKVGLQLAQNCGASANGATLKQKSPTKTMQSFFFK